jgi:hypothetical protein
VKTQYLDFLLSGNKKIKLDLTEKSTIFLANLGLLVPLELEENTFTMTAPILQDCISVHVLRKFVLPPEVLPPIREGKLDVLHVLIETVKHLNYKPLERALNYSTKRAEINDCQNVLKEAVYSLEFIALLRAWFPLDVDIIPEVDCEKDSADILIRSDTFSVILEFLSNERYGPESRKSSMLGHIKRAVTYRESIGGEAWVIHFVSVPELPPLSSFQFPEKLLCPCVYVYHLHDFTSVQLVCKEGTSDVKTFTCK